MGQSRASWSCGFLDDVGFNSVVLLSLRVLEDSPAVECKKDLRLSIIDFPSA